MSTGSNRPGGGPGGTPSCPTPGQVLFCRLLLPARKCSEEGEGTSLGPPGAALFPGSSRSIFHTALVEESHLGKLRHGTASSAQMTQGVYGNV